MERRKLNFLTLKEKAEIINAAKKGMGVTVLSKRFNIPKSTVCGILKKQSQILETVNSTYSGPGKRKTLRASELLQMEKALYKWFLLQRCKNNPVNGLILKEKAKKLHAKLIKDGSTFLASDGWLQNFKKRHGVRLISMKKITLRDTVTLLDGAWKKLGQETLVKCWTNILSFSNLASDNKDDISLNVLKNQIDAEVRDLAQKATDVLHNLNPEVSVKVEELYISNEDNPPNETESLDESDSEVDVLNENEHVERVTSIEAVNIFNKAILWATAEKVSPKKIYLLQSLRDKAVLNALNT